VAVVTAPEMRQPEPCCRPGSGEKDDKRHVLLRGGPSRTRVTGKIPELVFRQVHFWAAEGLMRELNSQA
jgi:hypothetical protein